MAVATKKPTYEELLQADINDLRPTHKELLEGDIDELIMFRTGALRNDPNDAYFGLTDPNEIKKRAGEVLDMVVDLESPATVIESNYKPLTQKPKTLIPGTIAPIGAGEPTEIKVAPERTKWQKFKKFFIGDRPPLPPNADRIEKITRAFDIAVTGPMRAFLKLGKGMTLNAPELMWAAIKRITPEDMWDDKVKNMTLDEAMDWAGGYNPSGFQKSVGEIAEFVGRLKTIAPIAEHLGIIGGAPKGAGTLIKAGETAKLFGTAAVAEQISKGASEIIDPTEAEYGYEGPIAVLRDMAIGAILSIAHSGVKVVWGKLTPTETSRALKILGLKKGASLDEINAAARNMARKYHPDKIKGFVKEFQKVIKARDILRQGEVKDIVFRGQNITIKPKLLIGEEAVRAIKKAELDKLRIATDILLRHGKPSEPMMVTWEAASIRSLADILGEEVPETTEGIDNLVKQGWDIIQKVAKETIPPAREGAKAPQIAPEQKKPAEVAEIPPKPVEVAQIEKLYGRANKFIQDIYKGKNLSPQEQKIYDSAKTIGDKTTATARIISERGKAGEISEETLGQLEWVLHPVRDLETGEMIDPFNFEGGAPRSYQVEIAREELDELYKRAKPARAIGKAVGVAPELSAEARASWKKERGRVSRDLEAEPDNPQLLARRALAGFRLGEKSSIVKADLDAAKTRFKEQFSDKWNESEAHLWSEDEYNWAKREAKKAIESAEKALAQPPTVAKAEPIKYIKKIEPQKFKELRFRAARAKDINLEREIIPFAEGWRVKESTAEKYVELETKVIKAEAKIEEAEPAKVEKKTLAEIKKETPAERKYFTDLLLNERKRIINEAKGFIDQVGPDVLVQDFQPRINEIDKDLRRRGYNPTNLPKLGPELKKAIAEGWVPVKTKEKLKAKEVEPKGVPSKIGFPKGAEKIELPTEPTAKEPVSAREIITSLSKALRVPYANMATHRPRMAAGWYEARPRGIRQINVRDLDTAAHEVGHHIDHYFKIRQAGFSKIGRRTWKMPEGTATGTAAELTRLGKMLYGERKPKGGYRSEGIAEYIRGYLTGHLNVEKEAPKFHKWFTEDYLPNNPEVATGLENARILLTDYRLQGAEARIESQINTKEIKGSLSDRAKAANLWMQQMFVDEFAPLRKGLEEAGIERGKLKPTEDPYELAVYFTQKEGARARQMVLFGTIDLWGNKTGKGLKEIMKPIADQNAVRPFTHFVVAARSLNLWKRGINPGISKEDAQHVYDLYKDNEGWQETAKEITEWNHRVLNYLVQAGALPKETAENMIEANPIYVPFLRAFAKGEKRFGGGGAGAGLITTKKGVFAIKGSGREIIDPFESMVTQTRRMIAIAHKNVIARSLANLEAKHRGLAGLIWKVPAPKKATTFRAEQAIKQLQKMGVEVTGEGLPEPGEMMEGKPTVYDALMTIYGNSPIYLGKENIIAIVQDGKKSWYEVSPDMYKLLQGLDKFYMPRFIDVVFGKAGRAMRLGATGLNASFGLVRNPIRDMQDTIFKGTHARGPGATVKGVTKDLSRLGLAKSMGIEPSKAAQEFVAMGGQISGFIGQDRKSLQHLKGEMLASSVGRYSIHTVKHPIDAMREVFGIAESGPRIQEYEKALEYGEKKYGKGSPNAKVYAFNKAQDQTINYSRHGVIGKWLNQMIPFWNANAQDISKVSRTFRERGKAATAYATAFLTLPAFGLWWYNKDEEWYKELPAFEKANYLHVKIPGNDSIIRIPVPFLVGHIFQGFPVAIVDALYKADKSRVTEFFKEVLEADVYSLTEWPAIISPVIDVLQNKDWAGRPIIPKSVEGKLPSDQYKEYTTQFAKDMGEIFGQSPAQIEHLMNSWSGGLYRRAAVTAEIVAGRREKELAPVDIPVIGKLLVRDPYAPKASIEKFYNQMDNLDRKYQSEKILSKEMLERTKLNRAGRELAEIWKELREEKTIKGRERLYGQVEKIIEEAKGPMTITEIRSEIRANTHRESGRREDGTIYLMGQPHKGKEKYIEALKEELRKR